MTPDEERKLLHDRAVVSATLKARASQRPGGSTPVSSGYRTSAPAQPRPAVDAYTPPTNDTATDLGGAPDVGGPPKSYGINEGDQSMADPDSFGAMLEGGKAGPLIDAVRQQRAAQAMTAPTFGDAIARGPAQPPSVNPQAQAEAMAEQQAQQAAALEAMRFVVDTRTGHFSPVMPDEDEPAPGPHDIVVKMTADDPSNPIVLGQGKRVTAAALSRLSDPKRGIQPQLHPEYRIKPQHAAIAQALGVQAPEENA